MASVDLLVAEQRSPSHRSRLGRERISRYRVTALRPDFPRYCPQLESSSWSEFTDISRYMQRYLYRSTPYVEVPNLPVDVASALIVQRRLYLHLFRDGGVLWRSIDLRWSAQRRHLPLVREVVTGIPRSACRLLAGLARNSRCGEESSLGIAPKGSTDMSRCSSPDRSSNLGRQTPCRL